MPILLGTLASTSGLPTLASSLNSFGVVAPQTKSTYYTTYSGTSKTGPHPQQFTRMTSKNSGRPGGMTYTDIVLDGDFFVCFFSQHGGDFYNSLFLYADTYKDFTHLNLGQSNSGDFGYQAQYGVYLVNGNNADIWDGFNQPEGTGGTAGQVAIPASSSGYIGLRRASGKFYTYYSTSAPGASGFSAMTLLHGPSSTTYTGKVRLGMFVHDAEDYLEVYSPGTFLTPMFATGGECDGLGVSVADGANANNSTPATNTGMTWYASSYRLSANGSGNSPLDYDTCPGGGNFTFHTGHTFPDYWPLHFAVQASTSTPRVLNQIQWKIHGNGIRNVDIFGSNRSITSSNYTDETLYTFLGRVRMNGGSTGSDCTTYTDTFNSAGLGYRWYLIKGVDNRTGSTQPYPDVDGSYGSTSVNPSGWAMFSLRLNKV
jgi:hypothetical protein